MKRNTSRGAVACTALLTVALAGACAFCAPSVTWAAEEAAPTAVTQEAPAADATAEGTDATAEGAEAAAEGESAEGAPEGFDASSFDASSFDASGFSGFGNNSSSSETTEWSASTAKVDDTASTIFTAATGGVVILCVLVAVFFIFSVVKLVRKSAPKKKGMNPGVYTGIFGVVGVVCAAAVVVANVLAFNTYSNSLNALFQQSQATDSSIESSESDWQGLAKTIGEEGTTLLKNENSALPLASGSKVNLLGYRAYDPVYTGSGSGSTNSDGAIDFKTALESAGFEVNTAAYDAGVYNKQEESSSSLGFSSATFTIDEAGLDKYTGDASFESMKSYSDTAIVVIGRTGGEGSDLTQFEGNDDGRNYLQLSAEEEALLKKARETFGTVVVLYNGVNTLEMGELADCADAVVYVGIPGNYGLAELGNILNGTVNPSGHTTDTWAYDLNSAAASENYGEQAASNGTDQYYVDYVEGIYVGYKWYETAYTEGAKITNTDTGTTYDFSDYESVVQYPFGYGLSYTTFEQKIVGGTSDGTSVSATGEVTVQVQVTNTGSVAGKDAVELYLTSPYTDYDKTNGVEKAAVQLLAFDKTKLLEPGESQTIELTFNVEDMASYDMSHDNGDGTTGSYMLDAGDYVLSVRSDSHTVLDSTTVKMDSQYFFSGDQKRSSDETVAYNKTEAARGTYLSRADGFANYEQAMSSVSSEVGLDYVNDVNAYDASYDEAVTKTMVEGTDYASGGTLTLDDMRGLSYDDPKWSEIVSQLTIDELKAIPSDSVFGFTALDSIQKQGTSESDGPLGLSSMFSTASNTAYPSIPVLASTWNKELAATYGSYIADEAHASGTSGWYAPAMNTHRWAFSGRNFEYYSEDAVLAADMAAAETKGARDKGLIVYLKHFVLNDQETKRSGNLHTYANEQTIREIYMVPFEACVKDGDATAIMNSMNFVGDKWIGVCGEIQNDIVRSEWGFNGRILTDMSEGAYMQDSGAAALRNGTDMWLGMGSEIALSASGELTDADIYYLQNAAHNALYAEANAEVTSATILPWQVLVRAVQVALGVAAVSCVLLIVKKWKNAK